MSGNTLTSCNSRHEFCADPDKILRRITELFNSLITFFNLSLPGQNKRKLLKI